MENIKQNSLGNKAISPNRKARTASRGGRAPFFLSYKLQATSFKRQAELQATSAKLQATSYKRASSERSVKQQASNV